MREYTSFGRMTRWLAGAALVGGLAAGCGASEPPPKAKDGTDTSACYSASCEIRVNGKATFTVDPSVGVESVTVTVADSAMTVVGTAPGISVSGTLGKAGTSTGLNNLIVKLVWVSDSSAIVSFSPS